MNAEIKHKSLNVLVLTTLYPNNAHQRHGIFIEHRLRQMSKRHNVQYTVIAPVTWTPSEFFKKRGIADQRTTPSVENRHGVAIYHPRYFAIPGMAKFIVPFSLHHAFLKTAKGLRQRGMVFDLIDAHYFYPDGAAAAMTARSMNKPYLITARGSDINYFADKIIPKLWIRWVAHKASHCITVSQALADKVISMQKIPGKTDALPNGVDLSFFKPSKDRTLLRTELGWDKKTVLYVGNLIPLKGVDLIINAMNVLNDYDLRIVGNGPELPKLQKLVAALGMQDRVTFYPNQSQQQLCSYYQAADLLVLASSREGYPNVLLESLACGTPVVASNVGGIPEIMSNDCFGRTVERSVGGFAEGIQSVLEQQPRRALIREAAHKFDWSETCDRLMSTMNNAVTTVDAKRCSPG